MSCLARRGIYSLKCGVKSQLKKSCATLSYTNYELVLAIAPKKDGAKCKKNVLFSSNFVLDETSLTLDRI